jgi:hypothetical protein
MQTDYASGCMRVQALLGGIASVTFLLALTGCHKPVSFVGTWKTTSSSQGGSDSTMTFNADKTMSFSATNGPKQSPYKLTGMGTWKSTDKDLTVIPAGMQLDMPDASAKAKVEPYLKAQVNVPQTGPVVWKNKDEFICTKNGVAQHFQRVK